jgi:hypothetical protein
MPTIDLAISLVFALLVLFSGIGKIRRDSRQVNWSTKLSVIGVPLIISRHWLGASLLAQLDS